MKAVTNLRERLEDMLMAVGPKRNQHYINMDGYRVYYEQIGSRGHK